MPCAMLAWYERIFKPGKRQIPIFTQPTVLPPRLFTRTTKSNTQALLSDCPADTTHFHNAAIFLDNTRIQAQISANFLPQHSACWIF